MIIERLPVIHRPGYDCIRDNANCPGCKTLSEGVRADIVRMGREHAGNHGISGGLAVFTVRSEDKLHAVTLEVMLSQYPSSVPDYPSFKGHGTHRDDPPRGGGLFSHRSIEVMDASDPNDVESCEFVFGACRGAVLGYLVGDHLYKEHGNQDPRANPTEQSEAFWRELEQKLVAEMARG